MILKETYFFPSRIPSESCMDHTDVHRSGLKRNRNQDLELRLGHFLYSKRTGIDLNCGAGLTQPVTIDDDDDLEVQVLSPRSHSEAQGAFTQERTCPPIVTEEDLELRLGFRDDDKELSMRNADSNKKKTAPGSSSRPPDVKVNLTCAICMDSMKDETSTICGHIFCNNCISNAIQIQKKCPTCRKRLSVNNIHRIYLPGTHS